MQRQVDVRPAATAYRQDESNNSMTTKPPPSVRAGAARGAVLTGMAQVYRVGLSFVTSVLLARLLTPLDFGLVAMVSSSVAFVSLIQDLGLNQATIQRERISPAQISALFWLSTGFSLLLATLLAAFAPAVAWFFGDSRLTALTMAFACLVLIGGSQSQQLALLNRELRFQALAGIDVLGATAAAVAGIAVAWLTSSYWALFFASLASTVVGFVCVWMVCGFRPGRPSFEGDFKEIARFGSGISGFNIVNYFARNADNLLIGRFYGGEQLGLYDRAYRLLLFPLSQVLAPLGRVMLPLLARLQSDPERYRKAYTECISLLMMATQPGLVFVVIFADEVFLILLGPHWAPAVPIFRWLGVAGLFQVVTSTTGWLFISQGRGGDFFKVGLFNSIVAVGSFVVGISWGPLGVAASYTVACYTVLMPAALWSSGRRGPVCVHDFVLTALPHAAASAASGLVLAGIYVVLPSPSAVTCLGLASVSYAVYGFIIIAFPAKRLILRKNIRALVGIPFFGRYLGPKAIDVIRELYAKK
jgi:PST family polysaccharide transporter